MFNLWYWVAIVLSVGSFFGLHFLLRNRSDKTKKIVLFSILAFALLLHFLKVYFPPYSVDQARMYRDIWFINICAVSILIFPFIFLSKNQTWRDYMVYLGLASGIVAMIYPIEPLEKSNQAGEILDIIRFYIHHSIIWVVPLLMITLKLHKVSYKRLWRMPACLLAVFLFIMVNQLFQQELGFTPVRGGDTLDITDIGYKNTSYIWGADEGDVIGDILDFFCPDVFKTIPVGKYAGQRKHWPLVWLVVPVHVLFLPLCAGMCMIFDRKNFIDGIVYAKNWVVTTVKSIFKKAKG